MKRQHWPLSMLAVILALSTLLGAAPASAAFKPQDVFYKKYPHETISIIKSADLNGDKLKEFIILTKSGKLVLVNSKGIAVVIQSGITSDDGCPPPTIRIYTVTKTEKHVAVTFSYFPSNTQLFAYRLKNGTLATALNVMGDLGVSIDAKGRVHQYWKKYLASGGWNEVEAIYTWNSAAGKYKGSGQLP